MWPKKLVFRPARLEPDNGTPVELLADEWWLILFVDELADAGAGVACPTDAELTVPEPPKADEDVEEGVMVTPDSCELWRVFLMANYFSTLRRRKHNRVF